jgi:O-antigen/teichoic acid export membrane protein
VPRTQTMESPVSVPVAAAQCENDAAIPRRLTLRANFLWTLAGNLVYAACQWGIIMLLAKLGSPELVGEFGLALAITAPVLIGASLSLRNVQATDTAGEYTFGHYLSLRVFTTALALLIVAGVVACSGWPPRLAATIFLVGLAKGVESISDIFFGYFQQREQMDRIARSMIVKAILSLGAVALAICFTGNLAFAAAGMAAVWAVMLFCYDAPVAARLLPGAIPAVRLLIPRWTPRVLWRLVLLALPGGIVMMLISFSGNIPRYFIAGHLGTRELGIFAALVYPMIAGSTVIGALGQSATPRLAQIYARADRQAFGRLLGRMVIFGGVLGVLGVLAVWLAGAPILTLLYRPEYANHVHVFLWIAIAMGLGYAASFLGYGMTAARYFRAQVPIFFVTMLVTAAGCALLIPRYHLTGAAFAILAATVVQAIGSAAVIWHALAACKTK